ncbi:RWP-RK domain [Ostreococcus tauri]|uniref:RWP-RK domain n=1 Tax=Ostreococcus tauri TaxID=70448 RepID=A0A090ME75_OSTTA|nr:RWP-RK domain [Ostreococcus tauri]CEG01191.1 RWP-RK domain [Ostreococcus tauri]|eukprot:XP_022840834.1 RWP-RK domain [Ostreococcus tauri]
MDRERGIDAAWFVRTDEDETSEGTASGGGSMERARGAEEATREATTPGDDGDDDDAYELGERMDDVSESDGYDYDDFEGGAEALMSVKDELAAARTGSKTSKGAKAKAAGEPNGSLKGDAESRDKRNQSRENRRVRQFRSASEITQEELSSCFHLPSEAACRKLGVGLTVLKRQCRKYGIKRWPFRKMKSLDRLITNVQAGISPGDQNRLLVKSVEELEDQKRKMEECAMLDLDDTTKKLQQAYSKANHKARRNRGEATRIRVHAAANAVRELEARRRGGYGDEPNGAGETLLELAHKIHDITVPVKAATEAPVLPQVLTGFPATAPPAMRGETTPVKRDDATLKPLLSNTPTPPAGNGVKVEMESVEGKKASTSSNPKPMKGDLVAANYVGPPEKVLTAVRGAWSPARPARRTDDPSDTEAFLSPRGRSGGSRSADDDDGKLPPKPRGRGRPPGPSKRGRKRKGGDMDDDPLASLAAAALDSMGNTRPASRRPGRKPSVGIASSETAKANANGRTKSAVTEDHPAFGLAPVVKGARSGAQSRLSGIERAELEHMFRDRLTKVRDSMCEAFQIDPTECEVHFSPKLQATSLATAVEKLATRNSR